MMINLCLDFSIFVTGNIIIAWKAAYSETHWDNKLTKNELGSHYIAL